MLEFSNLEHISTDALLHTFNESFSDYLVKMQLTKAQLERKLMADSIDLKLSAGAYEGGKLVGFILHGVDLQGNEKLAYNAGTGVIPAKRGQNLTREMYGFILPLLEKEGITKCVLEVLEKNIPAIKTYKAIGYTLKRELVCLKGKLRGSSIASEVPGIKALKKINWTEVSTFWDWQPSWQNSVKAMQNLGEYNKIAGIYDGRKLVAYISYNPDSNRIAQFAVHQSYRRRGYGRALFKYVAGQNNAELSVINVDIGSGPTITFLGSIGLFPYIYQYEMEKPLFVF
ncbi:GNAT superfamily N-acetyltransferase [Pedobacter africanus]|uniref:GNAT superfamily N-acetyltransferase n=1 Tax=Pedobacter africanus TaxID=151894 RepID=A0ACC6L079_9SPHI|nr:GNAT family N-acetyltransferase [Pedobacter africanus]MDR6785035.1 GNAT superfamily N-acetyltransferase [Pedobacter africanus]